MLQKQETSAYTTLPRSEMTIPRPYQEDRKKHEKKQKGSIKNLQVGKITQKKTCKRKKKLNPTKTLRNVC